MKKTIIGFLMIGLLTFFLVISDSYAKAKRVPLSYCVKVLDLSVKYKQKSGYPQVEFVDLNNQGIAFKKSGNGQYTVYSHASFGLNGKLQARNFWGRRHCLLVKPGFIAGLGIVVDGKRILYVPDQSIDPCRVGTVNSTFRHALRDWQKNATLDVPADIQLSIRRNYNPREKLGESDEQCYFNPTTS